jgi:hypothetical protein
MSASPRSSTEREMMKSNTDSTSLTRRNYVPRLHGPHGLLPPYILHRMFVLSCPLQITSTEDRHQLQLFCELDRCKCDSEFALGSGKDIIHAVSCSVVL